MLQSIEKLHLSEIGEHFAHPSGTLSLSKAWPRTSDLMGLEFASTDGQKIPGQWIKDPGLYERTLGQTSAVNGKPHAKIIAIPDKCILLHFGGADRQLIGLSELLWKTDGALIVHRPERRAVVEFEDGRQARKYAKVVRPKKVRGIVETWIRMRSISRGKFAIPRLTDWNVDTGVTEWSELPGTSLFSLLTNNHVNRTGNGKGALSKGQNGGAPLAVACQAAGRALRRLHETTAPGDFKRHGAEEERRVMKRWLGHLHSFNPSAASLAESCVEQITDALMAGRSRDVLIHRDFYDKQIHVSGSGRVGLLDFDTLACGEASLDLANALVHIELRHLQGRCSEERGQEAAKAFYQGYDPDNDVRNRLRTYADASRLRLACVYGFRPKEKAIVISLLGQIGHPILNII